MFLLFKVLGRRRPRKPHRRVAVSPDAVKDRRLSTDSKHHTNVQPVTVGFPGGSVVKNPPADAGSLGLIPGFGSPGGGNGHPLQYYCLGNPLDRGAWWAIVHGVTKSWT